MSTIHVQINNDGNANRYLVFVKKATGLGFSEIKERIRKGQYVASFDSMDKEGQAAEFVKGIAKLGGTVGLYQEFRGTVEELSSEHFWNLLKRNDRISQQTQVFKDFETTKVIAVTKRDSAYLEGYTVKLLEGSHVIIEFDYNEKLWNFIQLVIDEEPEVKFYQVDLEDSHFDDEDKVSREKLLEWIDL